MDGKPKALARAATQAPQAWCSEQALRLDQLEEGMTAAAHEPASSACRKRRTIGLKQANKTLRVNRMVAWSRGQRALASRVEQTAAD
ncbi:hypothetical protein KWH03_18410 [Xanthomonas campestris pv. lawsoniae]|uniref:hypothetical protein n=1 Tax=Xanthomonas euvesicatoria TaxID=456327 RepID=UPI001C48730C|nr:hypothetical protein [Xanthomonas euvesicatoria]MBV6803623.1 hypothetical protein [Xanthomonas campestris pv. lawsoniae]